MSSEELVHEARHKQARLRTIEVVTLLLIILGVTIAFLVVYAEFRSLKQQADANQKTIAAIEQATRDITSDNKKNTELILESNRLINCLLNLHIRESTNVEECPAPSETSAAPAPISQNRGNEPPPSQNTNGNNNTNTGQGGNQNPPTNPPTPPPPPPDDNIIGCLPLINICI